jgi:hypothetical protein
LYNITREKPMLVVVFGAREREAQEDEHSVRSLLSALKQKYPALTVLSAACDKGIGKFAKDICTAGKDQGNQYLPFIEVSVHIYARLPKSRLTQVFLGRNGSIHELGEEFHVFVRDDRQGAPEDLITRTVASKRPLYIWEPGQEIPKSLMKPGQ